MPVPAVCRRGSLSAERAAGFRVAEKKAILSVGTVCLPSGVSSFPIGYRRWRSPRARRSFDSVARATNFPRASICSRIPITPGPAIHPRSNGDYRSANRLRQFREAARPRVEEGATQFLWRWFERKTVSTRGDFLGSRGRFKTRKPYENLCTCRIERSLLGDTSSDRLETRFAFA